MTTSPNTAARTVPPAIVAAVGLGFVAAKLEDGGHPVLGALALGAAAVTGFHSVACGFLLGKFEGGALVLDSLDQAAKRNDELHDAFKVVKLVALLDAKAKLAEAQS